MTNRECPKCGKHVVPKKNNKDFCSCWLKSAEPVVKSNGDSISVDRMEAKALREHLQKKAPR